VRRAVRGGRRVPRTGRGRALAVGAAVVLVAGGVTGGIAATSGGPAGPALYLAGIAENPCAPGTAVPVTTGGNYHFLPDSSVLSTSGQNPCTAAAVAASKQWLGQGTIPGANAAQRGLATRALLDLRLSVQPDGAVVAGFHPGWDYAWPRDSSFVAVALAGTGRGADAVSILRFLQRMQNPDGTWAARYYPDGSGAVNDGRPAELDAVGWVPWAVWSWAATQRLTPGGAARAELQRLYPMVARAADAAMASIAADGLPRPAMDYWEDKPIEQTLGTAAPLLAGLRSAAALAGTLGATADQTRWAAAAGRLSTAITGTFGKTGDQRTPEAGSGADAAVTFLGPPFASPGAAVISAANAARQALAEPDGGLRPGAAWHGAAGVAWTPETAMFALFDAGTGQQPEADRLLAWLAGHRTTLGELPEQVTPGGEPASVAPLAWTDALVLLTLLAQDHDLPAVPLRAGGAGTGVGGRGGGG
jgi:glucoamylase